MVRYGVRVATLAGGMEIQTQFASQACFVVTFSGLLVILPGRLDGTGSTAQPVPILQRVARP